METGTKAKAATFLNLSPKGFEGAIDGHPFALTHNYSVHWLSQNPHGDAVARINTMLRDQIADYLGSPIRAEHFLDYKESLGENHMGLLLGRLAENGPPYYDRDETHLLTFGATGCGKFVSNVGPNCLDYRGAVVVIDPKGEAAIVTARARYERHGQIACLLDPFGVVEGKTGHLPAHAQIVTYNPIMDLDPGHKNFTTDAARLANALLWTQVGNDPFWRNSGLALVKGLIMFVRTHPGIATRDLPTLRQYLTLTLAEFKVLFKDMQAMPNEAIQTCGRMMETNMAATNTFLGVVMECNANLSYLDDDAMRAALRDDPEHRFSLSDVLHNALLPSLTQEDLVELNNRLPASPHKDNFLELLCCGGCSLYIVIPQDFLGVLSGWLRLIVSSFLSVSARHKRFGPPTALFIDEAAQLGKMEMLPEAYGITRGNNIRIWTFWQALGTIEGIYPDSHAAITGNAIRLALSVEDLPTAEEFSKIEGMKIEFVRSGMSVTDAKNVGSSKSRGKNDGSSTGENWGNNDGSSVSPEGHRTRSKGNNSGGNITTSSGRFESDTDSTGETHTVSYTDSRVVEPKKRPEEIMSRVGIKTAEGVLRKSGWAVVWTYKMRYFEEPRLNKYADDNPYHRRRWV